MLLTDGISEEGDSLDLSKEAAATARHDFDRGTGAGREPRVSRKGGDVWRAAKSYFLNEPAGLEQILLKDVMEHTGTTAVEKPLKPVVAKKAEILDGVGIETAPALKGYVRFIAKPTADTILTIDQKDPLLVALAVWAGPLGGVRVGRQEPLGGGLGDLEGLRQVLDQYVPRSAAARAGRGSEGRVRQRERRSDRELPAGPQRRRSRQAAQYFRARARGFQQPVPITKMADGAYRGRIPIGQRQGLFRIRPLNESRAFPEVGFYRQEQELTDYGSNEFLLQQVASYTGGRFNPTPKQVFDPGDRAIPSSMRLWPGLLALAIVLNLAELFLRKLRAA